MNPDAFTLTLATLVLVGAAWIAFPTAKALERAGQSWAREWRAYVPSEVVPAFDRRTKADRRVLGAFLAVVGVGVVWLGSERTAGPLLVFVIAAFLPMLVWRLVRGMPALRMVTPRRVARPRATRFGDYLSGWAVLVIIYSAVAPAVYLFMDDKRDWGSGPFFVVTILQAVSGLVSGLILVRVARASLPAADEAQLYLQDADRASAMSRVAGFPAWMAFFLVQQLSLRGGLIGTDWYQAALVLAIIPVLGASVVSWDAKRRFRRRLWPDLPAQASAYDALVRHDLGAET